MKGGQKWSGVGWGDATCSSEVKSTSQLTFYYFILGSVVFGAAH